MPTLISDTSDTSDTTAAPPVEVSLPLDLDIRILDHPLIERTSLIGDSDYLTCKTDSTCDESNAC